MKLRRSKGFNRVELQDSSGLKAGTGQGSGKHLSDKIGKNLGEKKRVGNVM